MHDKGGKVCVFFFPLGASDRDSDSGIPRSGPRRTTLGNLIGGEEALHEIQTNHINKNEGSIEKQLTRRKKFAGVAVLLETVTGRDNSAKMRAARETDRYKF